MPESGQPIQGGAVPRSDDPTQRTNEGLFREIEHLRELMQEKIDAIHARVDAQGELTKAQFKAIEDNVATAFTAAKAAVGEQKADTTKQLDGLQTMLRTMESGLSQRFEDLKERMDRGQGGNERMSSANALLLTIAGLVIAAVSVAASIFLNK